MTATLKTLLATTIGSLLGSSAATAHNEFHYDDGSYISAAIHASYQSKGVADEQLWQVPGALMGGDAHGSEKGFSLDDAHLRLVHADDNLFVLIELGSHGHGGGSTEVEIEQALLAYVYDDEGDWLGHEGSSKLEVGQLKARFSPRLAEHPHERAFTSIALPYEIMLGGHYSEAGLRLQSQRQLSRNHTVTLGASVLQGDAFPGSADEGSPSVALFSHYDYHAKGFTLEAALWHFRSSALNRRDERASAGHSHSGNPVNSSDISFSGDSEISGLELALHQTISEHARYSLETGYLYKEEQGTLRDTTRIASLESEHQGAWFQLGLGYDQHQWALRYARLKLDNSLRGPAAQVLGLSAGLDNSQREPTRTSLSYLFQPRPKLTMGLELGEDKTSSLRSKYLKLKASWQFDKQFLEL